MTEALVLGLVFVVVPAFVVQPATLDALRFVAVSSVVDDQHEAQTWVLTVGGQDVRRFQTYRNLGEEMPLQSALILIHEPRALPRGGH